jgi:hypothetical protein
MWLHCYNTAVRVGYLDCLMYEEFCQVPHTVVTLLHCCYTVVTMWLHCHYTAVMVGYLDCLVY